MEESLLFVKYDLKKLNILDVEKKTLTLKNSEELERLCNYSYFFFLSLFCKCKPFALYMIRSRYTPRRKSIFLFSSNKSRV